MGRALLDQAEFDGRKRLIIEYEFSFLGVNLMTGDAFTPAVILYLTDPKCRKKAVVSTEITKSQRRLYRARGIDPESVIAHYHLVDDMPYFEKARWSYSGDNEHGKKTI